MLIFVHGSDLYRCQEKLKELKNNFLEKVDPTGVNIVNVDTSKFDFNFFYRESKTLPFLAKRRMIIVENFFKNNRSKDNEEKIGEVLEELDKEENVIIFFEVVEESKKWKKKAKAKKEKGLKEKFEKLRYAYKFDALENQEVFYWIETKVSEAEISISSSAVNLLSQYIGNNLWFLNQEIQKLVFYAKGKNRTVIEKEDVEALVSSQSSTNIFALVDAIGSRQKGMAVRILNNLLEEGVEPIALLGMLNTQLKNLIIVKESLSRTGGTNDLYKVLRLPAFVINKLSQQSRNFSLEDLKRIYKSLLGVDKKIKTGDLQTETFCYLLLFCI